MILDVAMTLEVAPVEDDERARLRRGDPNTLAALIARYEHRLYRYLLRLVHDPATAQDLFQQTWLRVMQGIRSFRPEQDFEPWLFSIAHNVAIDHLRRKQPESLDELLPSGTPRSEGLLAGGRSILDRVLDFERARALASVVATLPAIHREVLTLRFEEDMKLEQIAEVCGVPLPTVKSRLRRALEALRVRLEDNHE